MSDTSTATEKQDLNELLRTWFAGLSEDWGEPLGAEEEAFSLIQMLERAGYAIVPAEPTPDMARAGSDANLDSIWVPVPSHPDYQYQMKRYAVHKFNETEAAECWRAMIEARPQ